jgi:hypothetical protein
VANELEARVLQEVCDIGLGTRVTIIDTQYLVPSFKQFFTEMRPNESGSAGDENTRHRKTSLNGNFLASQRLEYKKL